VLPAFAAVPATLLGIGHLVVCQKLNSIGKRYRVSRGCDGKQGGSPKCCKKLAHGSLFERLISEADVQIALRFRGLCRAAASGMSVATNRTPAFCKPSRNAASRESR
jgi:hypothetical protein